VCAGDIGVRSSATNIQSQLTVGPEAFSDLSHNLLAPSVTLDEDTRVGAVQANSLNGQATGEHAFPMAAMPALPLGALRLRARPISRYRVRSNTAWSLELTATSMSKARFG
jgi:hypothetical protein